MKKVLLILVLLYWGDFLLAENLDGKRKNDIGVVVGGNFPMYKDSGKGVVVGLNYSSWASSGFGFKTGFQYISSIAYVDDVIGVPLAVSFRTKAKDSQKRVNDSLEFAEESASRYRNDDYSENICNAFFSFLVGLFSNVEFYAGITPGYITGHDSSTRSSIWLSDEKTYWENSWTEVDNHFSTSLDAGLNLNYRIWRFDLKIMPAFHFNVIDNFVIHKSEGDSIYGESLHTTSHIRWFFSISGGLTFNI